MDTQNATSLPTDRAAYGGFWIRYAADAVDAVFLATPIQLFCLLYRSATSAYSEMDLFVELGDTCLSLAIWWVYTAVLLSSSWQATIGKRVFGLKVVDYDGRRINFGRATKRWFASFLSTWLLCVGFLMIAWTQRRQGLHDFMANTLVVKNGDHESWPNPH